MFNFNFFDTVIDLLFFIEIIEVEECIVGMRGESGFVDNIFLYFMLVFY